MNNHPTGLYTGFVQHYTSTNNHKHAIYIHTHIYDRKCKPNQTYIHVKTYEINDIDMSMSIIYVSQCETDIININGEPVELSKCIKYQGAWIDSQLSFKIHINLKYRTAWWNLQNRS